MRWGTKHLKFEHPRKRSMPLRKKGNIGTTTKYKISLVRPYNTTEREISTKLWFLNTNPNSNFWNKLRTEQKVHTLAGADEEESVGRDGAIEQIDNRPWMPMADERNSYLLLIHRSQTQKKKNPIMKSLHAKQTNKKKNQARKSFHVSIKNQKNKQTVSKTKCGFLKYRFKTKRLMFYRDQK